VHPQVGEMLVAQVGGRRVMALLWCSSWLLLLWGSKLYRVICVPYSHSRAKNALAIESIDARDLACLADHGAMRELPYEGKGGDVLTMPLAVPQMSTSHVFLPSPE
jgi:hypothetical protein